MDQPDRFILRASEDETPPTEVIPTQDTTDTEVTVPDPPTVRLPAQSGSDDLYETIKRAFKDAIMESKDAFVEIITAGLQGSQAIDKDEEEPYIGYRERYNRLKFVFRLIPLSLIALIISVLLVFVSGHILATTVALVFGWAASITAFILVRRVLNKLTQSGNRRDKVFGAGGRLLAIVAGLLLVLVLGIALVSRGVNPIALLVYALIVAVLLYVAAREHYKWAELWIYRSDTSLVAERPLSRIFLMRKFYEALMLQKLDNVKETPSFVEGVFKIGRVFLNVPGEEDKYWNNLFFIVDPEQLIAAANQGSKQARSR